MNEGIQPHPKNAAGPFYVVNGCCASCELPLEDAPELFAFDGKSHCYVKRQPSSKEEFDKALLAASGAELACIRYKGSDPEILRRFAELGRPELCDDRPPGHIQPVFRNCVTFDALDPCTSLTGPDLARLFRDYVQLPDRNTIICRFTPMEEKGSTATFSYAWYNDNFHPIEFSSIDFPYGRWLIRHSPVEKLGSRSVSYEVHDWLRNDGRFCSIHWYSEPEWNGTKHWQDTPW